MRLVIDVQQDALQSYLTLIPQRLATSVVKAMNRITIFTQAMVKRKLAGEVLHTVTGQLRRSINRETRVEDGMVLGIVGTNTEYAAIHEYGFDGTVSVKAHMRRISTKFKKDAMIGASGKPGKIARWKGRTSQNQYVSGYAMVKAHTMHMRIPKRSFLVSTLLEVMPVARIELKRAMIEAAKPQ